ncbi:MAG: LytTR family transcriptional regulator DNA-binding domain-containing protein [Prevotella sp.]|nr:LytTR family transcriptional regulator DNA-binding domain-containing protein [Prevotella sp.]
MEWFRIFTSTEMVRVATDEIAYVLADGNYSDLVLINGNRRKLTFQLHHFDDWFKLLRRNPFVRVGRSLIVNKDYIHVINLTNQELLFTGKGMDKDLRLEDSEGKPLRVAREKLKELMELLGEEKGSDNE